MGGWIAVDLEMCTEFTVTGCRSMALTPRRTRASPGAPGKA